MDFESRECAGYQTHSQPFVETPVHSFMKAELQSAPTRHFVVTSVLLSRVSLRPNQLEQRQRRRHRAPT